MPDLPNIAFLGKAGSGKDTAFELLAEHLGYQQLSFAGLHPGGLRDVATRIWPDAINDRDKLIALGMAVREIDPDAWVNAALRHYESPDGPVGPVAVTDLRFPNEAWVVKGESFITVRVLADRNERINRLRANGKLGSGEWLDSESETALDNYPADYEVHNLGTKADLLDDLARVIALETGATAP